MHLLLRLLFFPVHLPPFVNSIPGVYKITFRGIPIPRHSSIFRKKKPYLIKKPPPWSQFYKKKFFEPILQTKKLPFRGQFQVYFMPLYALIRAYWAF